MSFNTPPNGNFTTTTDLPIVQKISAAFKLWYQYLPHTPKLLKHSLGEKINSLFIQLVELILVAGYSNKDKKLEVINKASLILDLLKYFLQMAFDLKAINSKQMAALAQPLTEVGKMLGGWQKQLVKETPPR